MRWKMTNRKALFVRLDAETARRLADYRWTHRCTLTAIVTAAVGEFLDDRTSNRKGSRTPPAPVPPAEEAGGETNCV
jgi:hypothetical protein